MNCGCCGSAMHLFRNPDRWICPNESAHAAIRAERSRQGQERGRKGGESRKGKTSPGSGNPKGKGGRK